MRAEMEDVLGPRKTSVVQALVRVFMGTATSLGIIYYGREIKGKEGFLPFLFFPPTSLLSTQAGFAARSGMSVGELVMTQLAYEAAACWYTCTHLNI